MFVMFCLSLLRTQLMSMFAGGKEVTSLDKVYDAYVSLPLLLTKISQITQRTRTLLTNASFVSSNAFAHRKIFFNHEKNGLLTKKVPQEIKTNL